MIKVDTTIYRVLELHSYLNCKIQEATKKGSIRAKIITN